MLTLTGNNLGERQRELNTKVNEAASNNVEFKQVRDPEENSDIDKLFKIDLASKYMNIDYIIEVLKSGDSLYVSRALKCIWMYDDKFSNIINADNLQTNVIPFMSTKMKKKLLSAISTYVRNEDRAAAFYKYCINEKLLNNALKFLNFTSDTFKLELLKDSSNHYLFSDISDRNLKQFIGFSFTLVEAYIMFSGYNGLNTFREVSYLYLVSEVKYLDMLEKSVVVRRYQEVHLGVRISKSIMKKHKNRVLKNPLLYVNILSKNILVRYSTAEEAKMYAVAILPDNAESFWKENYCIAYKFIIDIIKGGKFEFLKNIFTAKYPKQEFEMSVKFYKLQYYTFMTAEEQETWALKQIASEAEILGIGRDYIWYQFIQFEKAFEELKKVVMITPDNSKRADVLNILIESAKNQHDVKQILNYYFRKHINEQRYTKEKFLDKLLQYFNVYEFGEDCWSALNKIFHSLQVYSMTDYHNCNSEYRIVSLIYHIINKKEVHEAIRLYIRTNMSFYSFINYINTYKLSKEQREMVFHYLFEFNMDEIRKYENVPYDDEVRNHLRKYIHCILNLMDQYNRTKHDCPELVNKFMELDWSEFSYHSLHHTTNQSTTEANLIRYLKKDAGFLIENLPLVKTNIESSYRYNISLLLKKLKIYFSNDIAKDYLKFFDGLLTEDRLSNKVAQAAAHGIFQLANVSFKVEFMTKHAPTESKINHSEINEKLLTIQEAICAQVCYSRPPVPLKYMLMYIKGDYVHFCLPLFHSYLANLPLPLCIEFIEAILNTPISIQKHGIRLAFECFNAENLNKLVLHVWKKTKNVSLRMIIFKAMFTKVSECQDNRLLFDTLKTITLTLHQDDDNDLFDLLVSYTLPGHWKPEYIEAAWIVVNQLPLKPANLNRKCTVLNHMEKNINVIRQAAVRDIVDEFIDSVYDTEEKGDVTKLTDETTALIKAKWNLTAKYITYVPSKEDLESKLALTKVIIQKILGPLKSGLCENKYVLRQNCFNFLHILESESYYNNFKSEDNMNIIMQSIIQILQEIFCIEEIYMVLWELRLGILARKVISDVKTKREGEKTSDIKANLDQIKSSVRTNAINFGKELGNLIKEFIEKDIFFVSFLIDIKNKITDKIEIVKNQFNIIMKTEDMLVGTSVGLLHFEIIEIYLLVLNLLPAVSSPEYNDDYRSIINKIKTLNDKEIRCNLYKKFDNIAF